MTPEAQRIAIAKACGWRYVDDSDYLWLVDPSGRKRSGHGDRTKTNPWSEDKWIFPDYLNDLNSIAKAEKTLTGEQSLDYITELLAVCASRGVPIYFASATLRAEAFLRTLNLWTEGPTAINKEGER